MPSVDVASLVGAIQPDTRRSPLPGHEHQGGWGILSFPFDSGHVLALRVSPQNDFAPYTSVWHRTPDGSWSIYVDGPRLDTACPRYWGAATDHVQLADLTVEWNGPRELVVEMADPRLRWTMSMRAGPLVRAANAVSRALPERVLRWRPTIRLAERIGDHLFGFGDATLTPTVPDGQDATVLTRRLFPIEEGRARFEGDDLGRPAAAAENPTFGEVPLPARPVCWIGRAYLTVADRAEYETTLAEMRGARRPDDARPGGRPASSEGVR